MSKGVKNIDGYPTFEAKKLRDFDRSGAARYVVYKAIQHYIDGGSDFIMTWVDTDQTWDGHALALYQPHDDQIALKYFHFHREKEHMVQRSRIDIDVSEVVNGVDDEEKTDALVEDATLEFDPEDLVYTSAMLGKAALIGRTSTSALLDKGIMKLLYEDDENLNELAERFPTKNKEKEKEILPYASEKFMIAVHGSTKIDRIGKGAKTIYLRRNLSKNETYIMALTFHNSKLTYGQFIRETRDEIVCDLHNYEEFDSESIGLENDWDEKKLIRTVQTGLAISKDVFKIYLNEAIGLESDDTQDYKPTH